MISVVLKLPLSEKIANQDHVLVSVTPSGKEALDLKLEATEGTSPYVGRVSQSHISKLLAKNSTIDTGEWEDILLFTLLRQGNGAKDGLKSVETVATVTRDKIVLAIRKNISGIQQRIGEVSLTKDENHEIDTLSWVSTAVSRAALVEQDLLSLQAKYEEHSMAMENLNSQTEELIKARDDDENILLAKFCELLNAKKLKIRDQQRLLATAKVDRNKASEISGHQAPTAGKHIPTRSRATKRKPSVASSTSESAFESMEIRKSQAGTTDALEATTSQDEPDDVNSESSSQPDTVGKATKGGSDGVVTGKEDASIKPITTSPPPRRALPFGRLGGQKVAVEKPVESIQQSSSPPAAGGADGGEEETTSDDEL